MSRITKFDSVRGCYVIEPDNNQNHIQRLGELEDRDEAKKVYVNNDLWYCPNCKEMLDYYDEQEPFCRRCGQRLDWSDVNETL